LQNNTENKIKIWVYSIVAIIGLIMLFGIIISFQKKQIVDMNPIKPLGSLSQKDIKQHKKDFLKLRVFLKKQRQDEIQDLEKQIKKIAPIDIYQKLRLYRLLLELDGSNKAYHMQYDYYRREYYKIEKEIEVYA
jgi:hypothetical protein